MKTRLFVVGLLAPLTLMATPAAQADFHPACLGVVTGNAYVEATLVEDEVVASGVLECPGATESRIDLYVTEFWPSAPNADVHQFGSCSAEECLSALRVSIPTAAPSFKVLMLFDTAGPILPLTTYEDIQRCAMFTVTDGQLSDPSACSDY